MQQPPSPPPPPPPSPPPPYDGDDDDYDAGIGSDLLHGRAIRTPIYDDDDAADAADDDDEPSPPSSPPTPPPLYTHFSQPPPMPPTPPPPPPPTPPPSPPSLPINNPFARVQPLKPRTINELVYENDITDQIASYGAMAASSYASRGIEDLSDIDSTQRYISTYLNLYRASLIDEVRPNLRKLYDEHYTGITINQIPPALVNLLTFGVRWVDGGIVSNDIDHIRTFFDTLKSDPRPLAEPFHVPIEWGAAYRSRAAAAATAARYAATAAWATAIWPVLDMTHMNNIATHWHRVRLVEAAASAPGDIVLEANRRHLKYIVEGLHTTVTVPRFTNREPLTIEYLRNEVAKMGTPTVSNPRAGTLVYLVSLDWWTNYVLAKINQHRPSTDVLVTEHIPIISNTNYSKQVNGPYMAHPFSHAYGGFGALVHSDLFVQLRAEFFHNIALQFGCDTVIARATVVVGIHSTIDSDFILVIVNDISIGRFSRIDKVYTVLCAIAYALGRAVIDVALGLRVRTYGSVNTSDINLAMHYQSTLRSLGIIPPDQDEVRWRFHAEEQSSVRSVGLSNIGNTCHMNAGLQCILRTRVLRRFFDKAAAAVAANTATLSTRQNGTEHSLLVQLLRVVSNIPTRGRDAIAKEDGLEGMISALNIHAPHNEYFRMGSRDAVETLRDILDALRHDIRLFNKQSDASFISSPTYYNVHQLIYAITQHWSGPFIFASNPINDIFSSLMVTTDTCTKCYNQEFKYGMYADIFPVPMRTDVPQPVNLVDMIASTIHHTSAKSQCSNCDSVGTLVARRQWWTLPEILILRIQRGNSRPTTIPNTGSNPIEISVPEILRLSEDMIFPARHGAYNIMASSTRGNYDDVRFSVNEGTAKFRLIATVDFLGDVAGGHYISHVRDDSAAITALWTSFNDNEMGSPANRRSNSRTVVLMFYERIWDRG